MDQFKAWLQQPFRTEMSAFQWFLFFGLMICIAAAWRIILHHVEG